MALRPEASSSGRRDAAALAVTLSVLWFSATTGFATQRNDGRFRVRPWPNLMVVKPTLRSVVEDGWQRSPTFRRLCEDLAAFKAVVLVEWGTTDSQSRAISQMQFHDAIVVANVTIRPVPEAMELVAHELQHVFEKARGMDFELEAKRPGSGVWRAFAGYETQAAIDVGRQVWKEVSAWRSREPGVGRRRAGGAGEPERGAGKLGARIVLEPSNESRHVQRGRVEQRQSDDDRLGQEQLQLGAANDDAVDTFLIAHACDQ
jgi:hypothetical protein